MACRAPYTTRDGTWGKRAGFSIAGDAHTAPGSVIAVWRAVDEGRGVCVEDT